MGFKEGMFTHALTKVDARRGDPGDVRRRGDAVRPTTTCGRPTIEGEPNFALL